MNSEQEARQFDITIYTSKYLIPVLERKRMVVLVFLVCVLVSVLVSFIIKQEYVTSAAVLIEEPRSKVELRYRPWRREEVVPEKASTRYVSAEAQKLKSGSIANKVLEVLPDIVKDDLQIKLSVFVQIKNALFEMLTGFSGDEKEAEVRRPVTNHKDSGILDTARKEFLKEMMERVDVKSNIQSAIINLSVRSLNKEAGVLLLKAYIDVWMKSNLEENKRETRAKARFAKKQKEGAYKAYKIAEQQMIKFRRLYQIPAEIKVARDIEIQLEMNRLSVALEMALKHFYELDQVYIESIMKEAGVVGNILVVGSSRTTLSKSRIAGKKLISIGVFAGLILGLGLAILFDLFRGPIRHEVDITETLHLPVLGHIPKI